VDVDDLEEVPKQPASRLPNNRDGHRH
jgi:hypothetical protein